jgi:hypothetical protein
MEFLFELILKIILWAIGIYFVSGMIGYCVFLIVYLFKGKEDCSNPSQRYW